MIDNTSARFTLYIFDDYFAITIENYSKCLLIGRELKNSQLYIEVEDNADIPFQTGRYMPIYGIIGIYWLLKGPYLGFITDAKLICKSFDGNAFLAIREVDFMQIASTDNCTLTEEKQHDEERYLKMIETAAITNSLCFSYDYDITHTLQRIASFKNSSLNLTERADPRFFWNRAACSTILGIFEFTESWNVLDFTLCFTEMGYSMWVVPIVQAYIESVTNCLVNGKSFEMLYISRRSCRRQGTRFTMRGIDHEGNVTNFVETEQALFFQDKSRTSFVQIRGSIPLYWSSPVSMKYAPKVYQRDDRVQNLKAFQLHADEMRNLYGRLLIINLVDKKKEQLKLGTFFQETVLLAQESSRHNMASIRFEWFDFHHECRKMQWRNLEKLVKAVDNDFQDYGFFSQSSSGIVVSTQSGVLRTNCMDNLDRTNVIQSLFARRSLLMQLGETEALKGNPLESPFIEFERIFKNVWGNNADAISILYAGTGALKTDFTRTGKRTKKGALKDGWNSFLRYFINNFYDGERQDALDLLLQRYVPTRKSSSPFGSHIQYSPIENAVIRFFGSCFLIFIILTWYETKQYNFIQTIVQSITIVTVSLIGLFILAIKKGTFVGKSLVCLPRFRPQDGCATKWTTEHDHSE